jgi:hypothetical protein
VPKQPLIPQQKFAEHTKETKPKEQPEPVVKWTLDLVALGAGLREGAQLLDPKADDEPKE